MRNLILIDRDCHSLMRLFILGLISAFFIHFVFVSREQIRLNEDHQESEPIIIWKSPTEPFLNTTAWQFLHQGASNRTSLPLKSIAMVTSLSLHYKSNKFGSKPVDSSDWGKRQLLKKGKYFNSSLELGQISIENKLFYSHIHGYPLFYYHSHLIDPNRSPTWSKIRVVQHYLPLFEWIIWVDIDAISKYPP